MVMERRPVVLIHLLLALLLMALNSFLPATATTATQHQHHRRRRKKKPPPPPTKPPNPSSWEQFKSLLSCRSTAPSQVHDPSSSPAASGKHGKQGSTCGSSICAFRDVVHGNTRVVHRSESDHHSASSRSDNGPHETSPLSRSARNHPPPPPPSRGGIQLRKLSGCYECHAISVEPLSRYPRPRTLCACSDCGEVFTKSDSLELHRTLRHAVSELGPEDSERNIVDIIFKSSWQKKDHPICMIERILKVHNTQRTVARFEDYRDSVKARALPHLTSSTSSASASAAIGSASRHQPHKKNPRCAADGNELLRFHCTTVSCPLGARGSTALCISSAAAATAPPCGVCGIIRHGFARGPQGHHPNGVRTTASSGRAHDCGPQSTDGGGRRAMLVCRVIAGRIQRAAEEEEEEGGGWYDSVAGGEGGPYANLEELFVSNPRAILPCFVVIYRALD